MFDEGIVFFDTLGFGWVVDWDLMQQMYLETISGVTPAECFQPGDADDPPGYNPG